MRITKAIIIALAACELGLAQVPKPSFLPDERFKADLLLVVAHPDDESEIGSYLAKALFDEHKRVAVVFGTRGNGGGNALGQEQAAALASIREIEGRRALNYLGVSNVWFLDGPDTPGQDVLRSLETWDHGKSLGRIVRLVRLTRPSVIVTWLPAYSAGENHGDHQAAAVLATEAFDIAGDPTQYPEQVTPPRNARDISNLTEGLHPWQAQKLYFFSDASHVDFLKDQGPEYSATEISPSRNKSYARLSAEECAFHLTQSDSGYLAALSLQKGDLGNAYFAQPSRFIFGKSHVDAKRTGDIFDSVQSAPAAFQPAPGYKEAAVTTPRIELGGPWHFYHQFWQAHGLEQLNALLTPEVEAGTNTRLSIPVSIENHTLAPFQVKLTVDVPAGWQILKGQGDFSPVPGYAFPIEVVISVPPDAKKDWHEVTIHAEEGTTDYGKVTVRVHVASSSLPQ